ncbi:MAG TPA: asparagine synthase (glutamine-hydrolyzing) [Bacteroidales bacterium]|nr:asparagine synthase (glutamine-hydrolyzing) [Bacteroidales bacterium]
MCGIAGIISLNERQFVPEVAQMVSVLQHRGPNAQTVEVLAGCTLGHARLSIVDLKGGNQPMFSANKKHCIVFNGEIYGYKHLRDLLSIEYNFTGNSDTEVLLALYQKQGIKMLEQLPGAFAFALWDTENKQLFCARDRFGEKPFYYAISSSGNLVFASEIKSILASGLIKPVIDLNSVAHYLRKLHVHPYRTAYSNIFTLPPGHFLVFKNHQLRIDSYYKLPANQLQISLPDAITEFKRLLISSVEKQLVADVPVSAFLSGGLDSTSIVTIASKINPEIETFSFGMGSINEVPTAKNTAALLGVKHTELHAENFDIADLLLKMNQVYDEPFADSSNIPSYLIAQEAAKYTKVVLTGDGGDELLGGYSFWYQPLLKLKKQIESENSLYFFSYFMLKTIANRFRNVYRPIHFFDNKLNCLNDWKKEGLLKFHTGHTGFFTGEEIEKLMVGKALIHEPIVKFATNNSPDDAMKLDIINYMPGDILTKIDRASMANSLELRAPFLDKDLANFCISLPYTLKISDKENKILLRRAFEETWIPEVRAGRKQGFGAPVSTWLQLPKVQELIRFYLTDKNRKIFNFLNYSEIKRYLKQNDYRLWILLVLAIWFEDKS